MFDLYIFGKSFAQVKRFIGSKTIGDIPNITYGLATNKSFHLSKLSSFQRYISQALN
jgi:hypothetical protein